MKESVHLHAPVALSPDEKPRYPFKRKFGVLRRKANLLPMLGVDTAFLGHQAHSYV